MNTNATSPGAPQPARLPSIATYQTARLRRAAQDFEAFVVSQAFEEMFSGIETDPMFGGGQGESVFRSFLLQEYGKQVARAGGVGIADMVQRQLLQLQEAQ
jgi:Rod binding domain-containing protein